MVVLTIGIGGRLPFSPTPSPLEKMKKETEERILKALKEITEKLDALVEIDPEEEDFSDLSPNYIKPLTNPYLINYFG